MNDIIFKQIIEPDKSDLLVAFDTQEKANKLLNQEVDIYNITYKSMCYVGQIDNTYCSYGGATLAKGNKLPYERKITLKLWIDDEPFPNILNQIKTNKKNVTIQEIDYQVRNYLSRHYYIYRNWSNINKGFIEY